MSTSIRQSSLFSAEDYKKIFKAYSFIDYTAYDFDSLRQALIDYIRAYYPEDFNDYIESSEFVAIIDLIAYLGTSLAFRSDINSRENFIDTAERRESVIRLAQMVNYVPKRNITSSGLFKIAAVQTDQPLTDANGTNISNIAVYWNDPNNQDWFDQFILICNSVFSTINPFGRPTKSGTVGGISTDLYQLNNITGLNVAYPISVNINGQQYPVDVCNPDFKDNETIFERHPDPSSPFHFIYRNDSLGAGSANTGFFLHFRQGTLINVDTNFEFPVPNRVFPVDIKNINQHDVYVQETDSSGNVLTKWTPVPALAGENIIYNSIQFSERNIFSVTSGVDDTISIRFADGNFGNVPTGLFRTWVRVSANQTLTMRPGDIQGIQISIPYQGSDLQQYTLSIVFNLEQAVSNSAPSETDDQIKLRAPEVFSTQNRMVNGSDYNVLPLIYGNQISKIRAIARTYSGQSRYIDIKDPTGFHKDLTVFGSDGTLYRDNQNVLTQVIKNSPNSGNIESILVTSIQEIIQDRKVYNFFYDEYLSQLESFVRVDADVDHPSGYSILDMSNPNQLPLFWKTSPLKYKNDTGYFTNSTDAAAGAAVLTNSIDPEIISGGTYQPWGLIVDGSVIKIGPTQESAVPVSVNTVTQQGIPSILNPLNPYSSVGPVGLTSEIPVNQRVWSIYPSFRNELKTSEIDDIIGAINSGLSFWIYYDLLTDTWGVSTTTRIGITNSINDAFVYASPEPGYVFSNWANYPQSALVYVSVANDNQQGITTYDISARGRVFVFESYKDVRFYWEPNTVIVDNSTGRALQDEIEVLSLVNTNNEIDNNLPPQAVDTNSYLKQPIKFNPSGVFVQPDGFTDTAKIEVSLVDSNKDGIPDDPYGFNHLVPADGRVVFEKYTDPVTGYTSSRPWLSRWSVQMLSNAGYTNSIYVHFPIVAENPTQLSSSPYIYYDIVNEPWNVPSDAILLDELDLLFVPNIEELEFSISEYENPNPEPSIANQITAFYNKDITRYNWITGGISVDQINTAEVVNKYFRSKVYTIDAPPGFGKFYKFAATLSENPSLPVGIIELEETSDYYDKNGKSFTQNTSATTEYPFHFKWNHYSPLDQRIDPSPANIIDMVVITDSYYRDMLIWKNSNGPLSTMPIAPTTEELRVQFQDLNQYKMVSDTIVWNSGTFKVLFGAQAQPELRATFKVVKSPAASISDNEVKTRVVKAIDTYFDIRNWDFGEKFFYTELAAFIHQQLSRVISSVVIVPSNSSSQFGNLFEIVAGPTELFISTATVNNVVIVSSLTEQNMRV